MCAEPAMLWLGSGLLLLAGTVKGVAGLGLPSVSIAFMIFALGPHPTVMLMLVPSSVTEVYHATMGGHFFRCSANLWAGIVWRGTFNPGELTLVCVLMVCYIVIGHVVPNWSISNVLYTQDTPVF